MQSSSSTTGTATQEQHLRAQLELLKNPDADPASATPDHQARGFRRGQDSFLSPPPPPSQSNGYDHHHSPSQDAAPRSLASKADADSHIHPDLRAAAAAAASAVLNAQVEGPTASMMPIAPPSGHSPGASGASAGLGAQPLSGGEDGAGNGRKAKRELAQSKRAAQNRAAQRAFRQRKETYIKQLEQEVRDYREMEKSYKNMQQENYALREYVVTLQSRLLDATGEFPAPPANVNLSHSTAPPEPPVNNQEPAPHSLNAATPLEAVAQAVAGLAAQEQMNDRHQYAHQPLNSDQSTQDTRTADEINRHLQATSEDVKPPVV